MQKLKLLIVSLVATFGLAAPLAVVPMAYAAADVPVAVCSGATNLSLDPTGGDCSAQDNTFNTLITKIVNIFSVIVGLIAVLMIIFGGFRYITSGGDSTKVNSAKNTILYAIIGLIIVALAQVIVKFVLNKANGA